MREIKDSSCFIFRASDVRKHKIQKAPPIHVLKSMLSEKLLLAVAMGLVDVEIKKSV